MNDDPIGESTYFLSLGFYYFSLLKQIAKQKTVFTPNLIYLRFYFVALFCLFDTTMICR